MYCFAGCQAVDIAEAVGFTIEDLFDDPKGVTYEYKKFDRVTRRVFRSPSKVFRQEVIEAGESSLYAPNWRLLEEAIRVGETIYVPEGEKDVDAFAVLATRFAVTSPGGAQAWRKADWSPLAEARKVVVVADPDEPGIERARGLVKHLRGIVQGEVSAVRAKIGKDAADHLTAGGTVDEFLPVDVDTDPEFEQAVEQELAYRRMKQEALRREREAEAALSTARLDAKTLGQILDLKFEQQWVVPGIFEPGDRLIITGMEGGGKSVFLRQLSIMAAAGVDPFSLYPIDPVKVLVIDTENSERQWSRMAKYVTSLAESKGQRSPKDHVIVAAGASLDLSKPGDVNQIHKLIDEHRPGILQIGPLYKLVPREITTDTEAAPLIKTLDSFRERGVVLTMEAHSGSAGKSAGSLRPIGSSAFLRWPEFGRGLLPTEENPEFVDFVKWRGDREERSWPSGFRRGWQGELPWVPLRGDQDEYGGGVGV